MEDNDAFTVPAGAAEAFKAAGEPFAQGLCEEPGRSPTYRYANAFRRFWEQAALVPYDGGRLYPCGPNVWSARVNDCAMRPHFGLSRTYDCDWERLSQKAPEAAAALRADHEKVTPVPPPHRVGGGGFCHSFPNYARLLAEGFAGYRRRVEALPAGDFRDAMLVVLDGIGTYRRRCLELLRSSGAPEELVRALEHVPENPPRDIYEALVAWNFIYYVDGCDDIGALDRNLVPYFRGEDIVPLLRELFAHVDANDAWSGPLGPDCNEITLQCLRAIRGMRRPGLQLLVRRDTPDAVWREAIASIAAGGGQPALYNADLYFKGLRARFPEIPEEDLSRLCFGGCTETMLEGISAVGSDDAGVNVALVFEEAMRAFLESSPDFDTFYRRVADRVCDVVRETLGNVNRYRRGRAKYRSQPVRTLLVDDCLDRMQDFFAGGARWYWGCVNLSGMVNVFESLTVIRELVYRRRRYTARAFLEKLAAQDPDFLREAAACPRYGVDNDDADALAAAFTRDVCAAFRDVPCYPRGGYIPVSNQFITYAFAGKGVGPTPDGRAAGAPLADSLGAIAGHDTEGPTALLNSVASVPFSEILGTPIVNLRLRKDHARDFLRPLAETFFQRGGMQLQVSCLSREDMLDALDHPERHESLIVRIGGYSEYFNRLSDSLKRTVIARTEH
ncbi:MAG: hypothetical protein IJQ73_00035 [Kiritimatiellae bacterium]|nr:hypothetical protein [Kiritimatiellia bacterium]